MVIIALNLEGSYVRISVHNMMHIVVTALVVILSIASLICLIIAGFRKIGSRRIGIWALIALIMMFIGSAGTGIVPPEYFGIVERFSVFAAVGFNAVLGWYLFTEQFDRSQADAE